ncbi:MAG TPA: transglycosylase domain-containing protein [Actinophytocola sp.]|uniref:transglycosylase domain-containing protein n=1 Tax=Actinophytocola sp. TaxID=1872138 RepID=UPI002DB65470|nr:transglycosylase domain-containing protein [Actinophytocola sp.]HEU5473072.1 transglycosylase domain-containing protein [Actinophytocola sp.]
MNDHRDRRHRSSEPAWPTGSDPDAQPQERTGYYSPSWDDEPPAHRPARPAARTGNAGNAGNPGAAQQPGQRPRQQPPHPSAQPTRALRRPRPGGPSAPPGPNAANGPTVVIPRDNSRDETEVMVPAPPRRAPQREPDLITHSDDEPLEGDEELTEDERKARRKKIWRRVRRTTYVLLALAVIGPVLAFFIAYQLVTVPSPDDVREQQSRVVTLTYADDSELARIVPKDGERTNVKYEDLQKAPQVLNAVFAAEDATFMSNSGFDISGVMRAAWNQATGGEGGGSTITQQYIKKATGNADPTLTRKALEVVKAYKMNRTFSKEEIITAYLNTVYFGRNAYGIAAASKAYFAKPDLATLTPSESALLAGMIQSPSRYKDGEYMQRRWNYVMDQLVANNWLPASERAGAQFPEPVPFEQTKAKALTDNRGLIQRQVYKELEEKMGLTEEDIQESGYKIVTTIDPKAQELAQKAIDDVMKGQPENLRPALVAIDPKTGQVKAYWGGADGIGTDWASVKQEPGSSFKPFDLVALLKTGKGLGEVYDGSSPRTFKGGLTVRNSENAQCKECPVAEAMKRSINTVFYDIAVTLGTDKVAEAAHQAGIMSDLGHDNGGKPTTGIAIGGDKTQVSTLEMASAYATFAARGTHRTPHIVSKVLNPDGSLVWDVQAEEKPAFDPANLRNNEKIARNVTESLLPIPKFSKIECADGRECAGKTGTHQLGETSDNAKAWMVGYTPQLSTAVSFSGTKGEAIKAAGNRIVYGSGLPGQTWKRFMDSYHKTFKLPKEGFGKYDPIGKEASANPSSTAKPPPSDGRGNGNGNGGGNNGGNNGGGNSEPTRPTRPTRPPITVPTELPDPPGPGDGGG